MSSIEKGKILEIVTEILEKSISNENTIITRNKKLVDFDGIRREIDIYIETIVNKRKMNVAIECKNYNANNKIEIDTIASFNEKCSRLQIHRKIIVTTSDYQKGSIKKAKSLNVELYKIKTEKLSAANKKQIDIDGIGFIQKKCEIINVSFNSKELFENKVSADNKFNFYDGSGELIRYKDFQDKLIVNPDIWDYLIIDSGLLFNVEKIIYPPLVTNNIYTKFNGKIFRVDSMQFKLKIEIVYETKEIQNIKKYIPIQDNKPLAIFSDYEFSKDNHIYKFFCIKPADEKSSKYFLSLPNSQTIQLEDLGELKAEAKITRIKNVKKIKTVLVKPYEFSLDKTTVENALKNSVNSDGSKYINNHLINKPKTLVGIDPKNKKIFFMIPNLLNNRLITAKFPDPISLYFNHSIELYNKSIDYKSQVASNSLTDKEIHIVHDGSYHKYLQYSISSIFMLHSAIEIFINASIKDDFLFELENKKITKKEIEENFTLLDKLEKVVPLISKFNLLSLKKTREIITELEELNEKLQNLRTSGNINQPFIETFEKLLNFQFELCFTSVKFIFNKINKDYKLYEL